MLRRAPVCRRASKDAEFRHSWPLSMPRTAATFRPRYCQHHCQFQPNTNSPHCSRSCRASRREAGGVYGRYASPGELEAQTYCSKASGSHVPIRPSLSYPVLTVCPFRNAIRRSHPDACRSVIVHLDSDWPKTGPRTSDDKGLPARNPR